MQTEIKNKIIGYLSAYNPASIGIFGSFARGDNNEQSDLDILVEFKTKLGLLEFARITRELTELLGIKVDLVTRQSLKNTKLKEYIEKDLQLIYKR